MAIAKRVARIPVPPAWEADQIADFAEGIIDLDADAAAAALGEWIRTQDDRPMISGLRRLVAQRSPSANLAGYLSPDEAWGVVVGAIGTVGRYRAFPAHYPLVKHAVDMLGWESICNSENLEVTRAQFRMAYTPLLERAVAATAASPGATETPELLGQAERAALLRDASSGPAQIEGPKKLGNVLGDALAAIEVLP